MVAPHITKFSLDVFPRIPTVKGLTCLDISLPLAMASLDQRQRGHFARRSNTFHDTLTNTAVEQEQDARKKLLRTMLKRVWPSDPGEWDLKTGIKPRVIAALSCMVGGKLIMIQVPLSLKTL